MVTQLNLSLLQNVTFLLQNLIPITTVFSSQGKENTIMTEITIVNHPSSGRNMYLQNMISLEELELISNITNQFDDKNPRNPINLKCICTENKMAAPCFLAVT